MSIARDKLAEIISGQDKAGHSIFAPSGAAMWLRCLGSLIPNVLAPDDAGEEAAEGTVAHEVAEEWQKTGERPSHRIGEIVDQEGFAIEITEKMLAYVEDYINWCADTGYQGLTHYAEERVDTSLIMPIPNQGGTADHFACGDNVLVLTDLKYGKGVAVFCAEDPTDPRTIIEHDDGSVTLNGNPQVLMYAVGVFIRYDHLYHFEKIVVRICQPRLGYFGVWETTRSELLRFMQYVMDRAPLALEWDAPRYPHPKACQFCNVKARCVARLAHLEELADDTFVDTTIGTREYSHGEMAALVEIVSDPLEVDVLPVLPSPTELSLDAMEKILPYRRIVEGWFEAIQKALIQAAVVHEEELKVWKIVEGRTNRKFKDEELAAKELLAKGLTKEQLYTTSMLSPAQAEEALHELLKVKKKEAAQMLEDLVYQPPGPKSLALRTDSRLELPSAGDVFEPIPPSQHDEL